MEFGRQHFCALLALTTIGFSGAMSLPAQSADFAGKTIEIIVPAGEGGGTDLWARFYVPVLQDYLPGNPTVVVRNMRGAGHTTGGNFFAANAKPDGLMLLASSGTGHFNYLLGDSRVKYEFNDMRSVVGAPVGGIMYVAGNLGISTFSEVAMLKDAQLLYGSQGPTSQDLLSFYALEQIGIVARPIFGMGGRSDARLAFERGDLNVDYQSTFAYEENVAPLVESGGAVPIFTFGFLDSDGNLVRDPAFPDIPHYGEIFEQVNGVPLSGTAKEVYMAFFTAGFGAQKLLSMPADTPDDIIQAYDAALIAAQADPAFLEQRESVLGPYPQFMGPAAELMKKIAISVSPEAKAAVAVWLEERFDATVN
ncbi:MAG: tripartite-type tricarboxylate transporter receptor subunit TctC [Paracoccaceae bacterium]|jgi:tripartite-type tricarboxylate transporter receptor subunit TctC